MQNYLNISNILDVRCPPETNEENSPTERRNEICEEFSKTIIRVSCRVLLDKKDFFDGYYNSTVHSTLYAAACLLLVVLWPVRHWATKVALSNADLDILYYRYVTMLA